MGTFLVDSAAGQSGAIGSAQSAESAVNQQLLAGEKRWLDEPLMVLDDHSPRAAVKIGRLREIVVRLLKSRIHAADEDRLQRKPVISDPEFLVRELGVSELDSAPPPDRPCPPDMECFEPGGGLPSKKAFGSEAVPRWTGGVLGYGDTVDRIQQLSSAGFREFRLIDTWAEMCPQLDDLVVGLGPNLNDKALDFVDYINALAWAVLGGVAGPKTLRLIPADLKLAESIARQKLTERRDDPAAHFDVFGLGETQPTLMLFLTELVLQEIEAETLPVAMRRDVVEAALISLHVTLQVVEPALARGR